MLAVATVLSNCLFLYWYRDLFLNEIADMFKLYMGHDDADQEGHEDHGDAHAERVQSIGDEIVKVVDALGHLFYEFEIDGAKLGKGRDLILNAFYEQKLVGFVLALVVLEHLILFAKAILHLAAYSKPNWVSKCEVGAQH